MCRVIAISNQKGGVGKTTTTVNLGIGLARQGKRVLLIDADPQGSLTASLGYVEPDEIGTTLATIMMAIINEKEFEITDGILHHKENVDLLPANIELSALEVTMGNVMSRELIMKEYIEAVRTEYDYILIDCMPSLGLMTINALVATEVNEKESAANHKEVQSEAVTVKSSDRSAGEKKKSIHDRLKENKEKLGQKSGKDNLQKGVELT